MVILWKRSAKDSSETMQNPNQEIEITYSNRRVMSMLYRKFNNSNT